jgi:hypothetical protein
MLKRDWKPPGRPLVRLTQEAAGGFVRLRRREVGDLLRRQAIDRRLDPTQSGLKKKTRQPANSAYLAVSFH